MPKTHEVKIERGDETYYLIFDMDGDLQKILFYSIALDEYIDATKELKKYETLTEPALEKFREWKKDYDSNQYDTLEEKYG